MKFNMELIIAESAWRARWNMHYAYRSLVMGEFRLAWLLFCRALRHRHGDKISKWMVR
jgi:hypothetical protein